MPQLDIDLFEDFLFFAFIALILGLGDEESEENVIERSSEAHLANFYMSTGKTLREESQLVAASPAAMFSRELVQIIYLHKNIAQSVERRTLNPMVLGSIPNIFKLCT